MEIGLITLAIMLATLLGWLLKQTFNTQPWVAEAVSDTAHHGPLVTSNTKLIALLAFLAVVTSFFALILSAYSLRMELGDWVPMTEPQLLWANTGMLILASIVFSGHVTVLSKVSEPSAAGSFTDGYLDAGFVFGQFMAWQQLQNSGQFITNNPANAFFLFYDRRACSAHSWRHVCVGKSDPESPSGHREGDTIRRSIELCTIYWHFLLLVWLILFGLLLST